MSDPLLAARGGSRGRPVPLPALRGATRPRAARLWVPPPPLDGGWGRPSPDNTSRYCVTILVLDEIYATTGEGVVRALVGDPTVTGMVAAATAFGAVRTWSDRCEEPS